MTEYECLEKEQEEAPKIYVVVFYAHWCIRTYKWNGNFVNDGYNVYDVPEVFWWDDHNGTYEEWMICPLTHTTTGSIAAWTTDYNEAVKIMERLKEKYNDR